MANFEYLSESVSDILFENSYGYLTEGATLDMNKKLRELQEEYKDAVKDIKKSYKDKDANGVKTKCDKLIDLIDKYEAEIDDIKDTFGSAVCGALFQSFMSHIKAFLIGIPTFSIGTPLSYIKDIVDMVVGVMEQWKKDEEITPDILNARRAKIKGLIKEMKRCIKNYKKDLLEALGEKEVKESVEEIKLNIYESCHAGEITEAERDILLGIVE